MPKITIDKNLCIGCGTCESLCQDVFEIDKEGKARVKNKKSEKCDIDSVVQACPVQAIRNEIF